jgi:hypothetical protein
MRRSGDDGGHVVAQGHRGEICQGLLYYRAVRYWPNPVHKKRMTEAGRGRWRPDKTPCPDDLTVAERNELFLTSVAEDPADQCSKRYNVRRTARGLDLFEAQCAQDVDDVVCHGYPTSHIPPKVLRLLLAAGTITKVEYERLV